MSGASKRVDQAMGGRSGEVPRTAATGRNEGEIIGTERPIQPLLWIEGNAAIPGDAQKFMPQPQAQRAQCPSAQPSPSQSSFSALAATMNRASLLWICVLNATDCDKSWLSPVSAASARPMPESIKQSNTIKRKHFRAMVGSIAG